MSPTQDLHPDTAGHLFSYNSFGELASASGIGETREFSYDGLGRLLETQTSDGVHRNTWDTMRDHATGVVRTRYGELMRSVTQGVWGSSEAQTLSSVRAPWALV